MEQNYEQLMKDAQWRKSRSIAFFNATNSAISIMLALPNIEGAPVENKQQIIGEWRDWFLSEYDKDYALNIARVGTPFSIAATVARLESARNLKELTSAWIALSQDERETPEVIASLYELKKKYDSA